MSGLNPSGLNPNIRLGAPPEPPMPEGADIDMTPASDSEATDGDSITIKHDDGSITIDLSGRPAGRKRRDTADWFGNLLDEVSDAEQSRVADILIRGIEDDLTSRTEWVETRSVGIKLLGLQTEIPTQGSSGDGAPVEGISRIRHPLLLEAVLRFQANARSEMLPTDGPVKVRDDGGQQNADLADALENDLNHYLTAVATEYYPDTDRMLLMLGFGGTAFKKVYFCPLRQRPVSETVDADDLIVNSSATDLRNARRVTHRVSMKPSTVRRLQILGVYQDEPLSTPMPLHLDSVQREKKAQEGVTPEVTNPEDRDREIYECYCELDLQGFEHEWKGEITGLEVPYCATIDVSSRKLLSLRRNYEESRTELPEPRMPFVKYTFVPGFGFYDIGLLNILGNTTNAITAAWRELLDAGMYACFPGFLMADTNARQNTNVFRVPPGGGALVKTGGMPIGQAIMPLPYKEPSPALMSLVNDMAQTGMRIGGTSEQQVGEGRADAPVGTTLAMIEQAAKIMNSVHKRMHASQAEEFQLLVEVFREHPESFWQRNRKPACQWDAEKFLAALDACSLVPQADPNTASHSQRVMKVMALKQLQAAQPSLYDPIAVEKAALTAIGFSNPEQFMSSPQAQQQPPPELIQAQAQIRQGDTLAQAATTSANARMMDAQTKARVAGLAGAEGPKAPAGPTREELLLKAAEAHTKAKTVDVSARSNEIDNANRAQDRMAKLEIEKMKLQGEAMRLGLSHKHELDMAGVVKPVESLP